MKTKGLVGHTDVTTTKREAQSVCYQKLDTLSRFSWTHNSSIFVHWLILELCKKNGPFYKHKIKFKHQTGFL